ncbi:hypothetical protein [Neobacillus sp. LXY-1]|uniref:hypothetical protein n=1 Tax=Neobacillus sp. LXY-1 TaxID=3379133 RepID=UPI003EE24397
MTEHAILFILVVSYNHVRKNIVLPPLLALKKRREMAKRRTIIEELHEEEQTLLVSGGEDFQTSLDLFLKDMTMKTLTYHTKRWDKENLTVIKRALENLKYSTAPLHTTEKLFKDVISY